MLTIHDASKQFVMNVGCECEYVCVCINESL